MIVVYIIILTWNGKKYLTKLYDSLDSLNYPREKYKILFIDSGSTDGSLNFLENLEKENKIKLIKLNKNLGFAGGNNVAIQYALDNGAKYVVLLNQDTFVESDFLNQLIGVADEDNEFGIVQPLILDYQKPNEVSSWGNELHFLAYGWCGGNHTDLTNSKRKLTIWEINYASAAAVLYQADVLRKIGLFDENYFSYHEDSDICLRARLIGYKIVLAPKAIVYHDLTHPLNKNRSRYFWLEKNRLYLILKFYKLKTLFLIWPMNFAMCAGQFLFAVKNGYLGQFVKSRLWFVFNWRKLWQARSEIQKMRIISDYELMRNFQSEIKYQEVSNFLLDKIANPLMKRYWRIVKKLI